MILLKLGFNDFAGFNAGCADIGALNYAREQNFNLLKVDEELAAVFSGGFDTGSALILGHTAP